MLPSTARYILQVPKVQGDSPAGLVMPSSTFQISDSVGYEEAPVPIYSNRGSGYLAQRLAGVLSSDHRFFNFLDFSVEVLAGQCKVVGVGHPEVHADVELNLWSCTRWSDRYLGAFPGKKLRYIRLGLVNRFGLTVEQVAPILVL